MGQIIKLSERREAPNGARFVEVENDEGKSISLGEWIKRDDGLWALRINPRTPL